MRIGCSSWSFRDAFDARGLDLLSFVALARELGLDAVEPLTRDFPSVSTRFLRALREARRDARVEISALALSNDFGHPDADERSRQVEDLRTWVRIARELDVDILRTFTGHLRPGTSADDAKRWVYEAYACALPAAERANVTLAVENHGNLMNDADELVDLVMHFGSSALALNPDPTNFLPGHAEVTETEREPVYASLEKVARFAVHAHVKFGPFDDAGRPTNMDLPRLLAVYRKHCYNDVLSIETFGKHSGRDVVVKGIRCLREMLDE